MLEAEETVLVKTESLPCGAQNLKGNTVLSGREGLGAMIIGNLSSVVQENLP